MSYIKKVVCLANSRKRGGSCFAGKEVLGNGYGRWIRPVSARESEEISEAEQTFSTGGRPQILDVVIIPMLVPRPVHHQRENHLIHGVGDGSWSWEKTGSVDKQQLPELLDSVAGDLWINESSTQHGENDRVSVAEARDLGGSLLLIQPSYLKIIVQFEPNQTQTRPRVRAIFGYNGRDYRLVVTDQDAEDKYQKKSYLDSQKGRELPTEYSVVVDNVYLCLSLGEEFEGYCYKLVATIIGDDD